MAKHAREPTVTVPLSLWRELLRVCEADILHRQGWRAGVAGRTWGCLEDCPACAVLRRAVDREAEIFS